LFDPVANGDQTTSILRRMPPETSVRDHAVDQRVQLDTTMG
jgi:hypothetical protein